MKRFALLLTLIALFFFPIQASAKDFVFPVKDGSVYISAKDTEAQFIVSATPGSRPSYNIYIYEKTYGGNLKTNEKKVFQKEVVFKDGSSTNQAFTVSGLKSNAPYYIYIGNSTIASGFVSANMSNLANDSKSVLFKEFSTEKLSEFAYTSKLIIPTPSNRSTVIAGTITVTKPEGYTQFNDGYAGVKAKLYYGKDFDGEQAIKGLSVDAQGRVSGNTGVLKAPVDAYKTQSGGLENIGMNSNGTYYYPLRDLDASGVYWVRELFTLPNGTYSFSDAISFDAERGFIPPGSAAAQELADQTSYRLLAPLPGLSIIKDPQQCELDRKAQLQKRGLADTPENRAKLSMVCDINGLIAFGIKFLIGVTAVILVVRLMFEGYQYMVTDVPMLKADAKSHFFNALIGLLLALSAYLILNTINPKLVRNSTPLQIAAVGGVVDEVLDGEGESVVSGKIVKVTSSKVKYGKPYSSANACPGTGGTNTNPNSTSCVKIDTTIPNGAQGKYLEKEFAAKLVKLNQQLASKGVTWRITEAWPGSREHKASCHKVGVCIDMNHTTGSASNQNPTVAQVKTVIESAAALGMCAQYEILSDKNINNQLVQAGLGKNIIFFNGRWISANHYSLYNGTCL